MTDSTQLDTFCIDISFGLFAIWAVEFMDDYNCQDEYCELINAKMRVEHAISELLYKHVHGNLLVINNRFRITVTGEHAIPFKIRYQEKFV